MTLCTVRGVEAFQDPKSLRVWYTADLDVDVDGAREAYRLDNRQPPALDDIHASAGWPHGSWWNVLVGDSANPGRPLVDEDGFCISMTSYQRREFDRTDRRRYLDAVRIPYSVAPGLVRELCKGVLCGAASRITDVETGKLIECVAGDFSGGSIGEASDFAAKFFDPNLSASNGDPRRRYLYEFFPGTPARLALADGSVEQYGLQRL